MSKNSNLMSETVREDAELARRKTMSFSQAEGLAKLPTQMDLKEMTQQLRSLLWAAIYGFMQDCHHWDGSARYLNEPWWTIAQEKHVYFDHGMADDYSGMFITVVDEFKQTFLNGTYAEVFDLTQFILRHPACPNKLSGAVKQSFEIAKAAYTLIDDDTIMPISSVEEAGAVLDALAATEGEDLQGPRAHLKGAAEAMTKGDWAASIRESINAVEAVTKIIEPNSQSDSLGGALKAVSKKHRIHEAMQKGFLSLYGFTSDEKGIRHSLLEKGSANVDAADAQYMLGACAAFVSYLLARSRESA